MTRPVELWTANQQTTLRLVAYDGPGAGAPSVVVTHGLGTGIDPLRDAVAGLDPYARLAAEGLNVLALDWPGHGRSGGRRGHLTYGLAMDAAATAAGVADLRWGGRIGIFGWAMGGVLAFYAALAQDGIAAVACNNVLDLRDVRPSQQRARQRALPLAVRLRPWLSQARLAKLSIPAAAVVARTDLAADPRVARALLGHPQAVHRHDLATLVSILLNPDDKPDIAAQTTPTFVAVGSHDRVLPETATRAFVSRLTCEHELWVLPGGGHLLALEHPSALLPRAAAFLRAHLA